MRVRQSRMTRRLQIGERVIDSTEALPLRKRSISKSSGPRLTGENERKQVMLCLPLRLQLATELLIR